MKVMILGFVSVFAIAWGANMVLTQSSDFSSQGKYSGQSVRLD